MFHSIRNRARSRNTRYARGESWSWIFGRLALVLSVISAVDCAARNTRALTQPRWACFEPIGSWQDEHAGLTVSPGAQIAHFEQPIRPAGSLPMVFSQEMPWLLERGAAPPILDLVPLINGYREIRIWFVPAGSAVMSAGIQIWGTPGNMRGTYWYDDALAEPDPRWRSIASNVAWPEFFADLEANLDSMVQYELPEDTDPRPIEARNLQRTIVIEHFRDGQLTAHEFPGASYPHVSPRMRQPIDFISKVTLGDRCESPRNRLDAQTSPK